MTRQMKIKRKEGWWTDAPIFNKWLFSSISIERTLNQTKTNGEPVQYFLFASRQKRFLRQRQGLAKRHAWETPVEM